MRTSSRGRAFFALVPLIPLFAACAASSPQIDAFPTTRVDPLRNYPRMSRVKDRPIDTAGVTLDVKHQNQQSDYAPQGESNLCWATSLAMVSTYLGNPRVPCQIASYRSDDGLSCCRLTRASAPADIERCNRGGDPGTVMRLMGLYHLKRDAVLTEEELASELSNGRPIIMHIELDKVEDGKQVKAYHAMVIAGFKDGKYRMLDPSRSSDNSLSYEQLQHGDHSHWKWIGTWYHLSYRADGCNPRFRTDCGSPP